MGTRGDEYRAKYSSVDPKIEQASTRAIAFVLEGEGGNLGTNSSRNIVTGTSVRNRNYERVLDALLSNV